MLLSKTCIYGLRASVLLASKKSTEFITIRELSAELGISFHFLTKVLQKLTRSELLESYKGPNGGVRLAKASSDIRFLDIVKSIDGDDILNTCALGLPGCGVMNPCPLHSKWGTLKEEIEEMMTVVTLNELALSDLKNVHIAKMENR